MYETLACQLTDVQSNTTGMGGRKKNRSSIGNAAYMVNVWVDNNLNN